MVRQHHMLRVPPATFVGAFPVPALPPFAVWTSPHTTSLSTVLYSIPFT